MRIGLTYDLREDYVRAGYSEEATAEFDSVDTIDAIDSALLASGNTTTRIGHVKSLAARLVAGERWDLVFNICEGMHGFGREAQVPALLEAYQIPCTFSDSMVCGLTLHKTMTKRVVMSHGVASPDFAEVRSEADITAIDLPFPLFAKPVAEGTGKGVSVASRIKNVDELREVCIDLLNRFQQPVLVETYLPGREFTVGILGTGECARVLTTMEVLLGPQADAGIYSYHNKENYKGLVSYQLLDEVPLKECVESAALDAWRVLGCRDAGRMDMRLDANGIANFIEVNPLAGLHFENSDLPIMARLAGRTFQWLIDEIVATASERCDLAQRCVA